MEGPGVPLKMISMLPTNVRLQPNSHCPISQAEPRKDVLNWRQLKFVLTEYGGHFVGAKWRNMVACHPSAANRVAFPGSPLHEQTQQD